MIHNLGKFAHPKKKASGMAKRSVSLTPQLGSQKPFPAPPKSKPDPVFMGTNDVSMTGATPGHGDMPVGTIAPSMGSRSAGTSTSKKPAKKAGNKKMTHKRAKSMAFFGSGY